MGPRTEVVILFAVAQLAILALDAWEIRRSRRAGGKPAPLGRGPVLLLSATTLVFLAVQLLGSWLLPQPLEILDQVRVRAWAWASTDRSDALATGPIPLSERVLLGMVLFYVAGFWDYIVHRAFSHSRWFWCTHEYHHLPSQVNVWMPGILVRPFAFLPATLSTIAVAVTIYGLLLMGRLPLWDLQQLLPVLLAITVVLTASHSAFLRRHFVVHRLLSALGVTSPHEHLLHHARDSRVNYGNFTTLWDRLFRTYRSPRNVKLEEIPLGLSYDRDFLGTITFGLLSLSAALRRQCEVARFCNVREPDGYSCDSLPSIK